VEEYDGVAGAATAVARGEMRRVMVGFRRKDQCARVSMMPFAVGTLVAYNVQSFTKPREPTARAAKGFPPPFTETNYPARGGQRPKAAPRKTGVMCCIGNGGS
jgi:hypothetical protein